VLIVKAISGALDAVGILALGWVQITNHVVVGVRETFGSTQQRTGNGIMSPHEGTRLGISQIIDTIHHSLKIATSEIIDGTERQSGRNIIQCLHFGPNILRRAADATGSSMHQVGTVTFQVRYGVIALHGIASTLASIRAILRLILVAAKIPNLGRA
jgi:hypothetical protein